ncbi:MAG: hypothetical protein FWH21_00855 [Kiritimatiellaeota bacterium]|nr:hypothetical protein [Kiritimatiellota bacterium]
MVYMRKGLKHKALEDGDSVGKANLAKKGWEEIPEREYKEARKGPGTIRVSQFVSGDWASFTTIPKKERTKGV